jgi:hypothetical protein
MMNAVNINLIAFARYTASVSGMVLPLHDLHHGPKPACHRHSSVPRPAHRQRRITRTC